MYHSGHAGDGHFLKAPHVGKVVVQAAGVVRRLKVKPARVNSGVRGATSHARGAISSPLRIQGAPQSNQIYGPRGESTALGVNLRPPG
eukprot:624352-Prorocentrum_minimum.AAC.1